MAITQASEEALRQARLVQLMRHVCSLLAARWTVASDPSSCCRRKVRHYRATRIIERNHLLGRLPLQCGEASADRTVLRLLACAISLQLCVLSNGDGTHKPAATAQSARSTATASTCSVTAAVPLHAETQHAAQLLDLLPIGRPGTCIARRDG